MVAVSEPFKAPGDPEGSFRIRMGAVHSIPLPQPSPGGQGTPPSRCSVCGLGAKPGCFAVCDDGSEEPLCAFCALRLAGRFLAKVLE